MTQHIVCFGECMIEMRLVGPSAWRQGFAGDTCNTAVYLSRLAPPDITVHYATGIGDDGFASDMRRSWEAEGIAASLSRTVPGRSTGLYTIRVDDRGERHFSYWRDTSAARHYFDTPTTPLEDAADTIDLLYLSGISVAILPPAARERLLALMTRLRGRGARVAWDNNYRPRLWESADVARKTMSRFCMQSDIALLTLDDELALNARDDEESLIARLMALPCAEVIVKRGHRPTLVRSLNEPPEEVPVEYVKQPLDTTAAGDSFAGAYLAARLRHLTPARAARAGNVLAGTVIQHSGAIISAESMPSDLWA